MDKHLDKLKTKLQSFHDLPSDFWDSLTPHLQLRSMPKDSLFHLSRYDIYFISQGYLAQVDTMGNIIDFPGPLDFIIDTNGASHHYYNAVTNCQLLALDLFFFDSHHSQRSLGLRFYRNMVREYWDRMHIRNSLLFLDKKDRKKEFLKQYPELMFYVPATLIAKYLQVSYDYFCRLPLK